MARGRVGMTLFALLAFRATAGDAQERVLDSASGDYLISYPGPDSSYTVRVVPPNRVAPELVLDSVTRHSDGGWEYRYRLGNDLSSNPSQRIARFQILCPEPSEVDLRPPNQGWTARVTGFGALGPYCLYSAEEGAGVVAGATIAGFVVRTTFLLWPSPGQFWGAAPQWTFPDDGFIDHDTAVHDLIRQVDGTDGGWVTRATAAPIISPEAASASVLWELISVLCRDPDWISDADFCAGAAEAARSVATSDLSRQRLGQMLAALRSSQDAPRSAHWILWQHLEVLTSSPGPDW